MEPFYWLNNCLTTENRQSCPYSLKTLAAHFPPSSVPLVGLFLSSTVREVRKSFPPRSPFDDPAWTHTIDVRTPHPGQIDVLTPTYHGRIDDLLLAPHLPACSPNCCVALSAPLRLRETTATVHHSFWHTIFCGLLPSWDVTPAWGGGSLPVFVMSTDHFTVCCRSAGLVRYGKLSTSKRQSVFCEAFGCCFSLLQLRSSLSL